MPSYDVEAARKAGLTDEDIAPALAAKTNYDLEGARRAGVPEEEIVNTLVTRYNQSSPLTTPGAGTQPPGLRPGKSMVERASGIAKESKNTILMRDPGVNYEREVEDFGLRAGFGRMSNDAERDNYLSRSVGQGNFGKDKYGRYYIHPEGLKSLGISSDKPIVLDKAGATRYDVADYAGDAPAMLGAIGGALLASGLGALPGMAAAGSGAIIGKTIDELVKSGQGLNLKTPVEQGSTIMNEGVAGILGEGIGRGAIGLGRFAMKPYGRFADPERRVLTREALDQGLTPRVFQFQPGGGLLARFQGMGEQVFSPVKGSAAIDKSNRAALERGISTLEEKAGTPQQDLGEKLIGRVSGNINALTTAANQAKTKASSLLENSLRDIQRTLGSADPNAGAIVQEQIKTARKAFGNEASNLYARVDQLANGQPIVPTSQVRQQLLDLMQNLPTDKSGEKIFPTPELKQFFTKYGDIADYQTTQQMQQLRTDFREASQGLNLVPGVDRHRARLLKESVDRAFEDAAKPNIFDATGGANSKGAIAALKDADEFYKQGIRKFDAPAIAALTRDASRTGSVEAARVVDTIIRPGYSASALRVKGLVPPEVWGKVQRSHFDSLVTDATRLVDGQEQISGLSLFNKIRDMGPTFNVVYGDKAAAIRKYATELAARDGKLDPSLLKGDIADNLRVAVSKQRELDSFLKDNYLSSLAKPGQEATQAADFIFRPNSPLRVAEAKRFYGEKSPEFQGLQNNAMTKLLSDFVKPGEDPMAKLFDGKALADTLNKYGKATLTETFGKETTDDLYKFARVAQFVTQENPNKGSIVGPIIALHPLRYAWKIIDLAGSSYLLRQPGAIKWLSEGIQPGNKAAAAAAITRLGALATAIAKDKTSSWTIDPNRAQYQPPVQQDVAPTVESAPLEMPKFPEQPPPVETVTSRRYLEERRR